MKIALASAKVVDKDIVFNLQQMEAYMMEAKQKEAQLVCFGESYLQGFNALSWDYEEDKNIAITVNSPVFLDICALSSRIGIDVLFGYIEREHDILYSSCALISEGKLHYNYRRVSRGWKEYGKTDGHYQEGTSTNAFDYCGKKCAIGMCGDLWDYPDRFCLGEDILFWPVYVSWTEEEWYGGGREEYAAQANCCCANTLYINSLCAGDAFGGAYWFAEGKIKEELPIGKTGLLIINV